MLYSSSGKARVAIFFIHLVTCALISAKKQPLLYSPLQAYPRTQPCSVTVNQAFGKSGYARERQLTHHGTQSHPVAQHFSHESHALKESGKLFFTEAYLKKGICCTKVSTDCDFKGACNTKC